MDPVEAARHFKSLARRDAFSRMEQELEKLLKTAPEEHIKVMYYKQSLPTQQNRA